MSASLFAHVLFSFRYFVEQLVGATMGIGPGVSTHLGALHRALNFQHGLKFLFPIVGL